MSETSIHYYTETSRSATLNSCGFRIASPPWPYHHAHRQNNTSQSHQPCQDFVGIPNSTTVSNELVGSCTHSDSTAMDRSTVTGPNPLQGFASPAMDLTCGGLVVRSKNAYESSEGRDSKNQAGQPLPITSVLVLSYPPILSYCVSLYIFVWCWSLEIQMMREKARHPSILRSIIARNCYPPFMHRKLLAHKCTRDRYRWRYQSIINHQSIDQSAS